MRRSGWHSVLMVILAVTFRHADAEVSTTKTRPVPPVGPATASTSTKPVLTSPVPGAVAGVPAGTGPGVHSPNSPFKPLVERSDVVSWKLLTDVKTKMVNGRILPTYTMAQLALNQKVQRVQGFMMPLEPGEKQKHFLLSSVPLTCSFCVPGGPESMVEVKTKTPVPYTLEPVVVEGAFLVLNDDSYGLYYRMPDAVAVK
jgi:uncharacterized protein